MENSTNTTDFPPESLSNLNNYTTKSDLPLMRPTSKATYLRCKQPQHNQGK